MHYLDKPPQDRAWGSSKPGVQFSMSKRVQFRTSVDSRKGGRKRTYDWPAFQREAIRLLEYEALPVETNEEGWRCQADLEKRMTKWCEDNWPKVPVESQIRTHTVKAIETFCEGRKGQ